MFHWNIILHKSIDASFDLNEHILIILELVAINSVSIMMACHNSAAQCAYQIYPIFMILFCIVVTLGILSCPVVWSLHQWSATLYPATALRKCSSSVTVQTSDQRKLPCDIWGTDSGSCWSLNSSGMWCCATGWAVPEVLKAYYSLTTWPWRWRHCSPSNCWERLAQQHSVTSQKNRIFRSSVTEPQILQDIM